jgi:peptidoglycan/LPS O-acetylase OafA/YrhL
MKNIAHKSQQRMNHTTSGSEHYTKLFVMVALSFAAMYILMYSMVNRYADVYNNFNQFYMAGLMAAPMVAIELLVMGAMYKNKRLNTILVAVSLLAAAACFFGIRRQAVVSDQQFIRSMIPHHSAAILMCQEANINSTAVKELCKGIVASQQTEIDQMKALLER